MLDSINIADQSSKNDKLLLKTDLNDPNLWIDTASILKKDLKITSKISTFDIK